MLDSLTRQVFILIAKLRCSPFYSPNNGIWVTYSIPQTLTSYTIKDCIWLGRNYGPALNGTRPDGSPLSDNCGPGIDPSTLKDETTGKVPWKDWPQAKRDRAVTLLNDADWQRLATSMPVGGTLDPGDSVKAPKIGIPGQEWDNPNTSLDDRRFKSIPGEYPRPIFPDFDHDGDPDETDADDDNDGFLDPYDAEPRNPYVPRVSNDPPPPPEDDRTNQSDGERAVSEERQSQGDFLEKPGNEALQNRLDKIEDQYKKAAGMENEAATDPNVGFEQQRLIDEADAELQQLKNEISQAWWSSLSQAEQQLFGSLDSGDIDEIRSHMEQWSPGTFEQDTQTYEEAAAKSILYHANDKGYLDLLKYLRDASNFDTARAVRSPRNSSEFRNDDTAKWDNFNTGEFLVVDTNGKILTYGVN